MEPPGVPCIPVETNLLLGCCREADRADIVASGLDQLRAALPESFHSHLIALAEEIRASTRLLRGLADRSQVHVGRVPLLANYLDVLLPCLSRTLNDITAHYEDKTLSRETRWRKMYNKMTEEAGGLPLPQRFVLYNHFLCLLKQLLTRSPSFDLNTLEILRARIVELPPNAPSNLVAELALGRADIFFATPISNGIETSETDSKVLFRRPFDNDTISIVVFLSSFDQCPYFLMRTMQGNTPWYSMFGAHELCIEREGSALQLKRWSRSEQCSKLWAALYFLTWEEMVLFYCTFVALKARNLLTVQVHPSEFSLHREKRLFQAQIIDDGFKHSLIVYEDIQTKGLRLHAAVWEGELRRCPVWTAFVTHQSQSPTWLSRRSRRRVWLKDVQLYVFCNTYHQENMRQNKSGAFEIVFDKEEAAKRFKELFAVRSAASETSGTESMARP
ncbi:ac2ded5a-847b-42b1-9134-2f1cee772df4 [Thermothielavioides terrestris]|uniref:Ac2ded5a-847b-42b1-9134-2f1cee772df4 n=1 Tax=Thermothielavioides terrestris TaxID=2587410 RepID=A0A3S4BFT6_9PEZI|nr:ac2ded5a-847b-42b1-9134-2f1cee772df4 [Thermothielavioides terrestris]